MAMIHESAIVDSTARLGKNVSIGPWTTIGPEVEIGDDSVIESHVVVKGPTQLGKNNHIFQFCSIGEDCQDLKYNGEPTRLEVGDSNVFREGCTIHRGTVQGGGKTIIGDQNLFMNNVHVAHDCIVGNHVIIAGFSGIAGHVEVDDWVILGGYTAVHQFSKIGAHSFAAHNTVLNKDVAPFVLVGGHPAKTFGLNVGGLKRRNYSAETIGALQSAYKILYRKGLKVEDAAEELNQMVELCPEIGLIVSFLSRVSRGLVR